MAQQAHTNNNNNKRRREQQQSQQQQQQNKKQKRQDEKLKPTNTETATTQAQAEEEQWELNPMFTYLESWKKDRINWKFNKTLQIRLLRSWRETSKFSKAHFKLFLEYVSPLKGQARLQLFRDAKKVMREQKAKVSKDAIAFVMEFMDDKDKKKMEGKEDSEILKMPAAKKFIQNELLDNTLYKRAKTLYNVLILTDEEQGSVLADESGEDDDDDDGEEENNENKKDRQE